MRTVAISLLCVDTFRSSRRVFIKQVNHRIFSLFHLYRSRTGFSNCGNLYTDPPQSRSVSSTSTYFPTGAVRRRSIATTTISMNGNGEKASSGHGEPAATIVTHDGTFHCDEALACYMLREHVSLFRGGNILRTRDPAKIRLGDVVVDVGGEYNPSVHRYDHHQRGFTHTYKGDTITKGIRFNRTKLSSAGLVYRHFGVDIVSSILQRHGLGPPESKESNDMHAIVDHVYEAFIEAIDAIDNGVQQFESDGPPMYTNNTDLSSRVHRLNPDWYEDLNIGDDNDGGNMMAVDERFETACRVTGAELESAVVHTVKSWLPARNIIARAYEKRKEVHPSGKIVELVKQWAPWKDHLLDLDVNVATETDDRVLYVVYRDTMKQSYNVQCVPVAKASFESRKPLPDKWRGLRDEELSEVAGIEGCVFVHSSGFIGGNKTHQGAMQMAIKALDM